MATALVVVVAQPAHAQDMSPTRRDEARGLFEAGRAAFSEGRYEDALGYFERSYALSELPELLYNIGHTAERIRHDERALEAFEAFLAARPDTEGRASIEARIATLRQAVADRRLAEAARNEARDEAREEARDEEAPTEPTARPAPGGALDSPTPSPEPASRQAGVGGWIVLGGGGLAAIAGGVLLGLAASSAATVNDAPPGTPWVDVEGAHAEADTFAIAGAVLLGVGGAAMAAGLVWGVLELPGDTEVAFGPASVTVRGRL